MQRRRSDGGINDTAEQKKESAFSEFYLDGKTKDMLQVKSFDIGNYEPSKINSQLSAIQIKQRLSTIHAPTLIERLQGDTNDRKINLKNSLSPRQFMGKDDRLLLSRVITALQSYKIDVQRLNGLRYECMR